MHLIESRCSGSYIRKVTIQFEKALTSILDVWVEHLERGIVVMLISSAEISTLLQVPTIYYNRLKYICTSILLNIR